MVPQIDVESFREQKKRANKEARQAEHETLPALIDTDKLEEQWDDFMEIMLGSADISSYEYYFRLHSRLHVLSMLITKSMRT